MELVRDGDRLCRTVAVLADDDVGLAGAGVVALDRIGSVQQDDHVRILLQTVVDGDAVGNEVVGTRDRPSKTSCSPILVTSTMRSQ